MTMADKDLTERRVYNLPIELLERLRAYQSEIGVASETEAARRLLETALQMRDTAPKLLTQLTARFKEVRDFRTIAKDILANHTLVKSIQFADTQLSFNLQDGQQGMINKDGVTFVSDESIEDWTQWPRPKQKPPASAPPTSSSGPQWDAPRGGDLDDEIPF